MIKKILVFLISLFISMIAGQDIGADHKSILQPDSSLKFEYSSLIIPALLISYGVIGIESDGLKFANAEINEEITEHIDSKFTIDDISQYTPFLSVYGLNALGNKGWHDLGDKTIILGTAYLLMGTSVLSLKQTVGVQRPDGSSRNSFPSGHTATAFMGAEFLYQEYKDVSLWYGISGYVVAAGTGFFRMYNHRHWLTDVSAGAGFGILCTKIAYWMHPFLKKNLFQTKKTLNGQIFPYIEENSYGIKFQINFPV